MRQIVLDTETTGRDPALGHRIIEIGAVVIQNREITNETFHAYLNPGRESEEGALAVHGLTQSFLQDKPLFSEVIDDFIAFLMRGSTENEVIIHNAKFDTGFFNAEIKRHLATNPAKASAYQPLEHYCSIKDSLKLAREIHPNQRNSLDALCKRYNVDTSKRNLHGALLDAKLLAQVYLHMTAGQPSFFDMFSQEAPHTQSRASASLSKAPTFDLPIYYATQEELNTHKAQLVLIQKESGACLWENE
jgi:DNA polymerase-3 subunit epsilon